MANPDRWLKNVSQADVARIAREKENVQAQTEDVKPTEKASSPPQPIPPPTTIPHPPPTPVHQIAPIRDFNRRANSIEREALPSGIFPGSSKKIYDAIYIKTRGAIQPRLEVQATKRALMDWSGIKNIKTIETHIRHLVAVGLMTRRGENGDSSGYYYGVRLPEENKTPSPSLSLPNQHGGAPAGPISTQESVMGREQKTVLVGEGQFVENREESKFANTYSKTNTISDDEAFTEMLRVLKTATKEFTGKPPSVNDKNKWGELAEVIIGELKTASLKTTSITSVPAFLVEHLRRRLNFTEQSERGGGRYETGERSGKPQINNSPAVKPITLEERKELVQMVVELVDNGGYTMEQAQTQFGPSLKAEDWHTIRGRVRGTDGNTL